jgi:hypothetical protein
MSSELTAYPDSLQHAHAVVQPDHQKGTKFRMNLAGYFGGDCGMQSGGDGIG